MTSKHTMPVLIKSSDTPKTSFYSFSHSQKRSQNHQRPLESPPADYQLPSSDQSVPYVSPWSLGETDGLLQHWLKCIGRASYKSSVSKSLHLPRYRPNSKMAMTASVN